MIKIFIINSKDKEIELWVNKNDTIEKVRNKYYNIINLNLEDTDFVFKGRILYPIKTIGEYKIRNDDKIYAVFHHIGGEFGAQAKGLADPTKKEPIKFPTAKNGPYYKLTDDGLNLFGICKNKNCIAYHKEVCSIFGFGTFDLIKDLDEISEKCPKCPSCENPLLKLVTCGFKRCKYSYKGYKIEDKKPIYVNYNKSVSKEDEIDYYGVSVGENESIWVKLEISANPL